MKKTIKNSVLIFWALGTVIPASAVTYLDTKFIEAIEQDCTTYWQQQARNARIDSYLERGANINLQTQNQETPIMRVVNLIARDGEALCESSPKVKNWLKHGFFSGACAIPLLVGMGIERMRWGGREWYNRDFDHVSPLTNFRNIFATMVGGATLLYSLYSFGALIVNDSPNGGRLNNMDAKLQVLKMLLKHPSIDLTLKNSQGKTVYDLVQDHLEKIKRFAADSSYIAQYTKLYLNIVNEINVLLKLKSPFFHSQPISK
jgi:hypothetical protein